MNRIKIILISSGGLISQAIYFAQALKKIDCDIVIHTEESRKLNDEACLTEKLNQCFFELKKYNNYIDYLLIEEIEYPPPDYFWQPLSDAALSVRFIKHTYSKTFQV